MSFTNTQQNYEMTLHHEVSISNSVTEETENTFRFEEHGAEKEKFSDIKPYTRPIIACSLGGVVAGLNDGSIGTILPRAKEYYNISDGVVSLLFMCSALGFVISALLNGTFVHKFKQQLVLYFASALTVVAFALLSLVSHLE